MGNARINQTPRSLQVASFGNQFTPDDVLDYYPVDRLMHDIALALMAVQTQTTEILDEFPTKAARTEATPESGEIPQS